MKILRKFLLLFSFALLIFLIFSSNHRSETLAQSTEESLEKLGEEIELYESEIGRLKSQASTLSNQIAQYDAQTRLTALKIEEAEEKIALLGGRIGLLEESLNALTNAFTSRAVQTYRIARLHQPYLILVSADELNDAVASFHYLQKIQEADRGLLIRLEDAQINYKEEKVDQEVLQIELEEQKKVLGSQKAAKSQLLEQTRNDEKRYQALLAVARSEFEAIQAIIAGQGDETEIGGVTQGQRIASVISGPSCNSSGGHLHFIVREGNSTNNPFNYLKGGVDFENCSGSSCGSGDADSFNPNGSWDWPINPRIKYTQGYGYTWAVANTWVGKIYQFHNGIDINNEGSSEVKAVKSGTLYRGSYTGYNGCNLRYVRVDHDDSNLDTLYLHINY